MRLILASNNASKLREMREMLAELEVEVVSQREAGFDFEVEETGATFAENARLKAEAVLRFTGEAAVADDSGLMVDALDGAPGVMSARFTGRHDDPDTARNALLLEKLREVPAEARGARFVSCVCCLFPDGSAIETRGECRGSIGFAPRGHNGFGYDPLFLPEDFPGRTMAELRPEEKNAVSHRGRAVRAFVRALRERRARDRDNGGNGGKLC